MKHRPNKPVLIALAVSVVLLTAIGLVRAFRPLPPLVIGICDPLAVETASDCERASALRTYDTFARTLHAQLGRRIVLRYYPFDAQIAAAIRSRSIDAAIAKAWTILSASCSQPLPFDRIADLPTAKGSTDLTGVFIVRADSPVRTLKDLNAKSILIGPVTAYEKSFAVRQSLTEADVAPSRFEVLDGCIPLAAALLEKSSDAGVISSYVADFDGLWLLGGAAQFREIARTVPVPFLSFAVSAELPTIERAAIRDAILAMTGSQVPEGLYTTGFILPRDWEPEELK